MSPSVLFVQVTKVPPPPPSSSLPPAASYASASPGEESTYNAHSSSTCCNTCAALGECAYATYSPPSPNQTKPSTVAGPVPGECFGLHVTSIPGHSTDPGPSVETVQDAFSAKFAASLAGEIFDPFLDYNVALFTADIDHYLRRADALGMPYLAASWPYTPSSSPSSSSSSSFSSEETGFSVLIQIGGSQLIVELLALSSPALAARSPPPLVLEQRMTDARVAAFAAAPPDGSRLAVASIGRAASEESFAALEDFYVNGAGATVSMNTTGTAAAGAHPLLRLLLLRLRRLPATTTFLRSPTLKPSSGVNTSSGCGENPTARWTDGWIITVSSAFVSDISQRCAIISCFLLHDRSTD